jgi:FAD/FMN-containing dehydrogenase
MKRRPFLKVIAASLLQPLLCKCLPLQAAARRLPDHRVRPSDASWPSAADWEKLREAVGGNLINVQPMFAACETEPTGASCLEAIKNMRNPYWIGEQPAGTQVSGWLDAWKSEPSAYAVPARNAADVAAAVNFARENNLRLVVKGGGHSYQGTSNAADSLLIWTRTMSQITVHDSFVAKGCESRSGRAGIPAVSAQAGAVWMDLYNAVTTERGRYVQGGGCTTVGVAGLIQSGGFGSFSKCFGTAASGLLEAEIVTADGAIVTVNACTNPDLFWALKGGGGGSWGVVTRVTLQTHALPEFFGVAWGKVQARSDEAFRKLIAQFIRFYSENLFNPHWGEQVSLGPDNTLKLAMNCQGLSGQETSQIWKLFFEWLNASPHDFSVLEKFGTGAWKAQHWWKVDGNSGMIRDTRDGAPKFHGWWKGDSDQAGAFLHGYDSLWLPASLLRQEEQSRLVGALFAGSRYKRIDLQFNKGLAGAPAEAITAAKQTATNPAVLDAFAFAIIADGGPPAYPGLARPAMNVDAARNDAQKIVQATAELRKLVPDAGSYVSESNYFNPSWQFAFWGKNYASLRAIKEKYDPEGLFFVRHGVGSEDWSADGFTRVTTRAR